MVKKTKKYKDFQDAYEANDKYLLDNDDYEDLDMNYSDIIGESFRKSKKSYNERDY